MPSFIVCCRYTDTFYAHYEDYSICSQSCYSVVRIHILASCKEADMNLLRWYVWSPAILTTLWSIFSVCLVCCQGFGVSLRIFYNKNLNCIVTFSQTKTPMCHISFSKYPAEYTGTNGNPISSWGSVVNWSQEPSIWRMVQLEHRAGWALCQHAWQQVMTLLMVLKITHAIRSSGLNLRCVLRHRLLRELAVFYMAIFTDFNLTNFPFYSQICECSSEKTRWQRLKFFHSVHTHHLLLKIVQWVRNYQGRRLSSAICLPWTWLQKRTSFSVERADKWYACGFH